MPYLSSVLIILSWTSFVEWFQSGLNYFHASLSQRSENPPWSYCPFRPSLHGKRRTRYSAVHDMENSSFTLIYLAHDFPFIPFFRDMHHSSHLAVAALQQVGHRTWIWIEFDVTLLDLLVPSRGHLWSMPIAIGIAVCALHAKTLFSFVSGHVASRMPACFMSDLTSLRWPETYVWESNSTCIKMPVFLRSLAWTWT